MNELKVAICYQKVASLINKGELCAADLKCLDKETKKAIWKICLVHCQQKIHCNKLTYEAMNEHEIA
ncbi:hypothetical protein [Shewanella aestuarii]|uniref:Uncharacterized protein n=1 Tax=Shewanella aestuarii TaxID=1028752 RepID=A0A6G9QJ41_9GAMM|nr:hypothetical protein [Shewanella aestuarii]QIR14574.1 hypothetical protein HBH39_08815 [Shewanella aestuarii]